MIFIIKHVSFHIKLNFGQVLIKNPSKIEKFERQLIKEQRPDFYKNLATVEEMYQEARNLEIFGKDLLDGLEIDIKIARILNYVGKTP